MSAAAKRRFTPEEYLELERRSPERHEFFAGQIYAMAGARHEHNLIVGNLITALNVALRGRCLVYPSDMRVFVPGTGLYTYPDVSVICGAPEFLDDERDTLLNPLVLCEVLS